MKAKSTILLALLALVALSCNTNEPLPSDDLTGTKWSSYLMGNVPGSEIYKVLEFQPGGQVRIEYRTLTGNSLYDVGVLNYVNNNPGFTFIVPLGDVMQGKVVGDKILLVNVIKKDSIYFDRLK